MESPKLEAFSNLYRVRVNKHGKIKDVHLPRDKKEPTPPCLMVSTQFNYMGYFSIKMLVRLRVRSVCSEGSIYIICILVKEKFVCALYLGCIYLLELADYILFCTT